MPRPSKPLVGHYGGIPGSSPSGGSTQLASQGRAGNSSKLWACARKAASAAYRGPRGYPRPRGSVPSPSQPEDHQAATCLPCTRAHVFFPHTFLLFTRSQCFGAQIQGQATEMQRGMSGQAAGERRWGRWLSEKVAEEGRISVDIGCPGKR